MRVIESLSIKKAGSESQTRLEGTTSQDETISS